MGEEVSDECLAALRAAGEVIGEKCKFTPAPHKCEYTWETPREVCDAVIGGIGLAINIYHFTEEKCNKYNFVDKGGTITTITKSERINGGTYKCTGSVTFYIKSKGFLDYMFQKLTRQPPKEVKELQETSIIVMPEEFPPTEELEIYRMAIDLEGLGKEWKEAGKEENKRKILELLNKDSQIKIIDFNIIGVILKYREDTEKTEADVEVAIDATAVKL